MLLIAFLLLAWMKFLAGSELESLWNPMLKVNAECPRFIYTDTGHDGLGDQLERLFMGLALAWQAIDDSVTIVVPDTFGKKSLHFSHGYHELFHDTLGLPKDISTLSVVNSKYPNINRVLLQEAKLVSFLDGTISIAKDIPCNTIVDVDIYDVCGGFWCPFRYSGDLQRILHPLLRQTFQFGGNCPAHATDKSNKTGKKSEQLDVVWHVRALALDSDAQQYACKYCANPKHYFSGIYSDILKESVAGSGLAMKHTIITRINDHHKLGEHEQKDKKGDLRQKYTEYFGISGDNGDPVDVALSESLPHVVCSFLRADVVVSTGSTFPDMVSWFAARQKPVVLAEERSFLGFGKEPEKYKYRWTVSNSTDVGAFHLENGRLAGDEAHVVQAKKDIAQAMKALRG